jgi:hypothetical protein
MAAARTVASFATSAARERYRYKVVEAARGECRDIRGYGAPIRVKERTTIEDPLPSSEGYHFLCVIGAPDSGIDSRQHIDDPAIVSVRIDTIPPVLPARLSVVESTSSWMIAFGYVDPEISAYAFKFGRPSETRCDDGSGYRQAPFPFLLLPKANRPYVFCAMPHDSALNPGPPYELLLP